MNPNFLEYISLRLMGDHNTIIHFKMRRCNQLMKAMTLYSDQISYPMDLMRFRFEGRYLDGTETPYSLGMQDGDFIEVFKLQVGAHNAAAPPP